ncbi:MAG: DUF4261 domain-containing protein [Polyangiaceae bacterium]|nr:DUF4261 domain-containing protein [Polyangiaceae bacterium]MCB9605597.1 DUF4261 domain-containing protein [Polyangiaceae bacterium]
MLSNMGNPLVLCIPGPWADRGEFLAAVARHEPPARFLFAGQVLSDTNTQERVEVDFQDPDPHLEEAFGIAGQGHLEPSLLSDVARHKSVAYLIFPLDFPMERDRIHRFTALLRDIGGIAVKVESSGIAHSWPQWFELIAGTRLDQYSACVTLIGGQSYYYSCGMHHFGMPDTAVSRSVRDTEAAYTLNVFNMYLLEEAPKLEDGHTFSIAQDAPKFRLRHTPDERHPQDDLFHNPNGLWCLDLLAN